MDVGLVIWFVGILLTSITINLRLLTISISDKYKYPLRIAIIINAIYILIVGIAAIYLTGEYILLVFISVLCATLLTIIFYVLKQRDIEGIKLGESLLTFTMNSDMQLTFVLSSLVDKVSNDEMKVLIKNGLDYILYLISETLKIDSKDSNFWLSVFYVLDNGRFKVLSNHGISNTLIPKIENEFQHKNQIKSIAGYAANKCEFVCITDLANSDHQAARYWYDLSPDMKKTGSIICLPIIKSVGETESNEVIAILCVSSGKINAYDCSSIMETLEPFEHKIESLVYCYMLSEV